MKRLPIVVAVSLCAFAASASSAFAAPPPLTDVTASIDCAEVVNAGTFAVCDYSATNTGTETLTCRAVVYLSQGGSVQSIDTDDSNVIASGQSFGGRARFRVNANSTSGNGRIVVQCQSRSGFVDDSDGFRVKL